MLYLTDEVKQLSHTEIPPNAEVIVKINLTDRHPLKIRAYRIHFESVEGYAAKLIE